MRTQAATPTFTLEMAHVNNRANMQMNTNTAAARMERAAVQHHNVTQFYGWTKAEAGYGMIPGGPHTATYAMHLERLVAALKGQTGVIDVTIRPIEVPIANKIDGGSFMGYVLSTPTEGAHLLQQVRYRYILEYEWETIATGDEYKTVYTVPHEAR